MERRVLHSKVKQYAVLNEYNVRLKVNDSRRLQVVCKVGCPWMIWASRLHPKDINETTWQIKTYIGDHSCIRDTKNTNCTARWLAKAYIDKWRVDPTYSTGSLQKDVQHDHILQVPLTKCSRAKKIALEMIHGNEDEQYGRIYDYITELRGRNPGTTIICKLDYRVFERIYICLQACKDGFKACCRPIISIDGCFLKGHFQGYLLAAVGIDANDCIYPLAYVVVESENTSSWCWNADGNRYEVPDGQEDQHVVDLGAESLIPYTMIIGILRSFVALQVHGLPLVLVGSQDLPEQHARQVFLQRPLGMAKFS
ncbi:hypothetical protein V6N13_053787 [Hibiscus sabdariffa]